MTQPLGPATSHEAIAKSSPHPINLYKAILGVQGRVAKVKRDATNPFFKSHYATLESVWAALREPLQEEGIAIVQLPSTVHDATLYLKTILIHAESGETIENTMRVPLTTLDPQGLGSAITYGCRYSLMAMLGLAPSDDDGEASVKRAPDGSIQPTFEQASETHAETIAAILEAFETGDVAYAHQCWAELTQGQQMALWVPPSKGGHFSTQQRMTLKKGPES